jgi:hypothetical protein
MNPATQSDYRSKDVHAETHGTKTVLSALDLRPVLLLLAMQEHKGPAGAFR